MIYKFRVILDSEQEDVFRDIMIPEEASFEDLHTAIVNAFVLDGQQMASFYQSDDDWNQGEEISLFDVSYKDDKALVMGEVMLNEKFTAPHQRFLYVYDFLDMWTFFVELFGIEDEETGVIYPYVSDSIGKLPPKAPDKDWDVPTENPEGGKGFDIFDGDDSFSQFGNDEEDDY
mgnify:CR=1 FL=1